MTPADRHSGASSSILQNRRKVYDVAKKHRPERWSGKSRAWKEPQNVYINPHLHSDALEVIE